MRPNRVTRYYLTVGNEPEREVSLREYVSAEGNAGFNGPGHHADPPYPACASFGASFGDGRPDVEGRTDPLA